MTKSDLEQQVAEIQTEIDRLGMELLSTNQKGVELLTRRSMIAQRLNDGDYDIDIPEFTDDPVGVKAIDNDA